MQIPFENYHAFLFDLDGTIADSMKVHNEAWISELKKYNLSMTHEILNSYAGVPSLQTVHIFNEKYGWDLDPEKFAHQKEEAFLNNLDKVTLVNPVYDIILKYSQVPMAIVSGGKRENVEKTLHLLKISQHFKITVTAEDTKLGKPHPEPFLKAANLLHIDPNRCLVFEDGLAGIKAAQAAQMDIVRVNLDQTFTFLKHKI